MLNKKIEEQDKTMQEQKKTLEEHEKKIAREKYQKQSMVVEALKQILKKQKLWEQYRSYNKF